MFSSRLRITGIDPLHAKHLWSLVTLESSRTRRLPMAFALTEGGRPVSLVVGKKRKSLPEGWERIDKDRAEALARALGVRLLVAVEEDAWRDIVEDVQTRWKHGDDHYEQAQVVLERLKIAWEDGALVVWPEFFTAAFRLSEPSMRRFNDIVYPPHSSAILYLFRKQAIWSALVTVKGHEHIETVSGHWSVRDHLGTFHPWQDGYRKILEAVEKVHAPPSLGFFGELDVVREMLENPRPGRLSRAIMSRQVIIDPMPPWMAATLGLDALSRAARVSMGFLERVDRLGIGRRFDLGGMRKEVKTQIDQQVDFERLLGFDPFDYLSQIVTWWSGRT